MQKLAEKPDNHSLLDRIVIALKILEDLSLNLELWKAQDLYFAISRRIMDPMRKKEAQGRMPAKTWIATFMKLADLLGVDAQIISTKKHLEKSHAE